MARGAAQKTIYFFEVREELHGNSNAVALQDWNSTLRQLGTLTTSEREVLIDGDVYIGEPYLVDGNYHLRILREKPDGEWLAVLRQSDKKISDFDAPRGSTLLELSYVAFLEFGNLVGLIRGSNSAPTASAVAKWLTAFEVLGHDVEVDLAPCIDPLAVDSIANSGEATLAEIKVHTPGYTPPAQGTGITDAIDVLKAHYGALDFRITITTGWGDVDRVGRADVRRATTDVIALTSEQPGLVSAASTRVVQYHGEAHRVQEVDLLKQRVTAKVTISTVDESGRVVSGERAVLAILAVAEFNQQALDRATA